VLGDHVLDGLHVAAGEILAFAAGESYPQYLDVCPETSVGS
jgi:hypothetical protein